MPSIAKIVVFTGDLSHPVRKNIARIDREVPGLTWLVLVQSPKPTLPALVRKQWLNLRRQGWRRIPDVLATLYSRLTVPSWGAVPAQSPGREYSAATMMTRPNLRVLEFSSIHAPEAITEVEAFGPDLGLSLRAPILRESLFGIPTRGTVNLHKGKVPDYRGMPPAFWELWNDESMIGCTVHWVENGLDTGPIAAATTIERSRYSTVKGLQLQLDEVGIELVHGVVLDIAMGMVQSLPQKPGGTTYRKPTLGQEAALERRLARLQPSQPPLVKRILKDAVQSTAFTIVRRGLHHVVAPRATVLLYHRVTDSMRDNLIVGIEQFDRQMELIRQQFDVISLTDMLAWQRIPDTGRPLVSVTFDDGYLDNYAHAAPILAKYQIPAAFFVSTGIIGTERPFPHDVRRGNPPIPTMGWGHLRELREAGFIVGSHTVNHIDCAAESEELVRDELRQSREDLRRELGLEQVIFSYPYGGRQHITPERLEMVKQAGYVGCVSAYGGSNFGTIDPYNIRRTGCHWAFSDQSFIFKSIGL